MKDIDKKKCQYSTDTNNKMTIRKIFIYCWDRKEIIFLGSRRD